MNKKKPEPKKNGRPEAITEEVVKKLLDGFRMGFNDTECCAYCEISRPTYVIIKLCLTNKKGIFCLLF